MKIEINSVDDLPLKKTPKRYNMVISFLNDLFSKHYLQIFFGCLYNLQMLICNRIDVNQTTG